MNRKWFRKILGGLSLTSALFVFQACYGSPQDMDPDLQIEGQVKSKTSGLPIKGIKVTVADNMQYEYTNDDGRFSFYTVMIENITLLFEDLDSSENGSFHNQDTLLTNFTDKIWLDIEMLEK